MATVDIPEREIDWSFGPSGGPGGQHANRSSTRAELRWDFSSSAAIDEATRSVLMAMPGVKNGVVTIAADNTRSQWRNRQEARRRLNERIESALRPTKRRRPTRTPAAARARRRQAKKRRADLKKTRRRPELD